MVLVAPKAGAGAVGVHEAGNQHGEEEDAEDGFDDRERASVRGNRRDAGSAERRQRAEAVVDEIEAIGNRVEVGVGIEVKRGGAKDSGEVEETRKAESDEEIDAQRAEDGLGIGMIAGEDAFEDNTYNENVEAEAEDDVAHREDAGIGGLEQPDVLGHRGGAKKDRENQE